MLLRNEQRSGIHGGKKHAWSHGHLDGALDGLTSSRHRAQPRAPLGSVATKGSGRQHSSWAGARHQGQGARLQSNVDGVPIDMSSRLVYICNYLRRRFWRNLPPEKPQIKHFQSVLSCIAVGQCPELRRVVPEATTPLQPANIACPSPRSLLALRFFLAPRYQLQLFSSSSSFSFIICPRGLPRLCPLFNLQSSYVVATTFTTARSSSVLCGDCAFFTNHHHLPQI